MYWSRTGSFIDLSLWAALMLACILGGWLLAVHVARLRRAERPYAGLAIGLLLFILAANLLGQLAPLALGYALAALLILGLGVLAAWRSVLRPRVPWQDFLVWKDREALALAVVFVGLLLLFVSINRGLAIFDDYFNLSLVSRIATGDLPPHFSLNPGQELDYHYGMHLLAASLVRVGGFFPWSAQDLYKAMSIVLALFLGLLWYRRRMPGEARQRAWLLLGVGVFLLFAGGSRWLLLLLPEPMLTAIGRRIELVGSAMQSASDLYGALLGPWRIEGDGPFPFPFAFVSGVSRPLSLAMGSNSALPLAALFLLLLLYRRRWTTAQGLLFGTLLASLAIVSDHLFALTWGGLGLAVFLHLLRYRFWHQLIERRAEVFNLVLPLLPGALLAPIMGGVLSQLLSRLLSGVSPAQSNVGVPGIALRWPPAIYSAHMGALSLNDPGHLLLALVEMGPLFLLAPWAIRATVRATRSGRLLEAGMGWMSIISFLAPLFLRFIERERDITRLTGAALSFWMILGLPYALWAFRRGRAGLRWAVVVGYGVAVLGGVALFPIQLIAGAQTQPTYFVQYPDAVMARQYWDRLEPDAWVMDPGYIYRSVVVFGRTTGPAFTNVYVSLPEYDALVTALDPVQIAQAGYSYVYIDRETWQKLSPGQQAAFKGGCTRLVEEQKDKLGDFRRLYDVKGCRK